MAEDYSTYEAFRKSDKYNHVFGASEVYYVISLDKGGALKPIGRGSAFNVDGTIEQTPVEEYGVEIVREYVDGKYTLAGRFESFFIPSQEDVMPNTQKFRDKIYTVQMVCAGAVAAKLLKEYVYDDPASGDTIDELTMNVGTVVQLEGMVLKQWTGVKFTGKGLNGSARGIVGVNVSFVAEQEYSGDEINEKIDTEQTI